MTHPFSGGSAVSSAAIHGPRFESHGLRQREEFAAFLHASAQARESASPNSAFLRAAPSPGNDKSNPDATHVGRGPQGSARSRGASGQATVGAATESHPTAAPSPEQGTPEPAATPAHHVPRFTDVPESAKYPNGPYRQAPEEYGGEWWLTNPFTGTEPWRTQGPADSPDGGVRTVEPVDPNIIPLPAGFVEIFGERPRMADYSSRAEFKIAAGQWEQDLKYFEQSGPPPEFDPAKLALATGVFETWGLGQPKFYEGRYGWMARFPDSGIADFEINANIAIEYTHQAVSSFQMRQLQEGVLPAVRHPYVPPGLFNAVTDVVLT